MNQTKYDPRLAGLRGSAAFMVALYHVAGFAIPLGLPVFITAAFDQAVVGFWVAVPVFLMLSMVLLLRSLDSNPDLERYFKRRIRRIWPIYFGSLIVIFLFFNAYTTYHLTPWDYLGFFTFTEYYAHPFINGPLGVFWTLQLEEAVYLFIPLIHSSRHKEMIGGALVGVGLAWTFVLFSTNLVATDWATQSYLWYTPPAWMLAYGLGILIYTGRFRGVGWRALRWLVFPLLLAMGFTQPYYFRSFVQEYELFYPLVTLGFAAVVATPPGFFRYAAVVGEGSYAMYATHTLFLLVFGLPGLPLVIITSLAVEFALRPREISRRLNLCPLFDKMRRQPPRNLPVVPH